MSAAVDSVSYDAASHRYSAIHQWPCRIPYVCVRLWYVFFFVPGINLSCTCKFIFSLNCRNRWKTRLDICDFSHPHLSAYSAFHHNTFMLMYPVCVCAYVCAGPVCDASSRWGITDARERKQRLFLLCSLAQSHRFPESFHCVVLDGEPMFPFNVWFVSLFVVKWSRLHSAEQLASGTLNPCEVFETPVRFLY